ncbi:hypothetical protein NBT05_04615 [Aquimarina sp. ERC-38]|uniref:DUF6734 family protein n=1 Tax=Aquimarina sp. ERC-38 TaxID=2949996 RepID=UPI0022454E76|nr:DUF6734 family protein [Aquimarina sp. ERC-38]UZO81753.1 hypothetical protein NBT05_04615 [Aquimarina sp. ERC-38]
MRIIYSLNTYPIANNRWNMGNRFDNTIYMTAGSILYTQMWYKDITLYVDPIGYEYLSGLPCRVIKVDFKQDLELWMESKLYAIEEQREPFVHLDTDVFLKKPLEFEFEKVIVERKDIGYYCYEPLINFFDDYCKDLHLWDSTIPYAWSCGVIGFKDFALRDEFLSFYRILKNTLSDNRGDYDKFIEDYPGYLEIALLLEQYNLTSMLKVIGIDPTVLIPGSTIQEQSEYANNLGYTHLLGASKYHPKNINKIKRLLHKKFPDYYRSIQDRLETAAIGTL